MASQNSPETPAAIRAKLTGLRARKAAIEDAITSLEHYALYHLHLVPAPRHAAPKPSGRRAASSG